MSLGTAPFEIRTINLDEYEAAFAITASALLFALPNAVRMEQRRAGFETGRTHAAWADGRIVGVAGAITFETTVPGGRRVPTGGVTRVGVAPNHTRQGVLTGLMTEQLRDLASRGDVLASLRASESIIYGRFGYGLGGHAADYKISNRRAAFRADTVGADRRSVHLLPRDEVAKVIPELYERIGRSHVGAVNRPAFFWPRFIDSYAADEPAARWCAVHTREDGQLDGFVDYEALDRMGPQWEDNAGVLEIHDLFAGSIEAYASLWRHVLDRDLADVVKAPLRPIDEPLRYMLADPRQLRTVGTYDEQWVRVVDVGQALAARSYGGHESVTLAVRDALLPQNTGTYEIDPDGARRSERQPDIELDVSALGAVYLGGTSFAELAVAGLITATTPDATSRADRLFASRPLPWCGTFF